MSDTVALLEEYAQKTGWDESSMLYVVAGYLDNQSDDGAFEDYLKERVAEELADGVMSEPLDVAVMVAEKLSKKALAAAAAEAVKLNAPIELAVEPTFKWLKTSDVQWDLVLSSNTSVCIAIIEYYGDDLWLPKVREDVDSFLSEGYGKPYEFEEAKEMVLLMARARLLVRPGETVMPT